MSLMPDNPPEPGTLHELAMNYRTAMMYGEVVAAWVRLEAYVAGEVHKATIAGIEQERERIAKIMDDYADDAREDGASRECAMWTRMADLIRSGK